MLLTVRTACERLCLGPTKFYELVNTGKIELVKIGRASRVSEESLNTFLATLPRKGLSASDGKGVSDKRQPARAVRSARPHVDFTAINAAALKELRTLVARWLPGGECRGREYVVLNPTRPDRHVGSFRINTATGMWADFATGDKGGDAISLYAYIKRLSQFDAAVAVAQLVGAVPHARRARQ